jgi:hypothetical protein
MYPRPRAKLAHAKLERRRAVFTGSQAVAEKLTLDLKGKVKLEDAGFDWKILGPDPSNVDYVAWQSDQDAYAFTGQKCSAQSILFMHENWVKVGIEGKLKERAEMRTFKDYSLGPILSWDNTRIKKHINDCLAIPVRGTRRQPRPLCCPARGGQRPVGGTGCVGRAGSFQSPPPPPPGGGPPGGGGGGGGGGRGGDAGSGKYNVFDPS